MPEAEKLSKRRHRVKMSRLIEIMQQDNADDRPSFVRYCRRHYALYGDWPDPEEEVAKGEEEDDDE